MGSALKSNVWPETNFAIVKLFQNWGQNNNNMLGVFTRFYFVHKKHMVLLPAQGALEKPARKNNEDHVKKK